MHRLTRLLVGVHGTPGKAKTAGKPAGGVGLSGKPKSQVPPLFTSLYIYIYICIYIYIYTYIMIYIHT